MNQNQMIEELLRLQPNSPARRVLTPEVMPRGMPPGPYGGGPGMLPDNSFIEGYGRTLPPAAGGMGLGLPAMVGAGMLYPSMIGDTTGREDAMAKLDRLSGAQGKVLPTPAYSPQETSAMIDEVMKGPSKRPKMEMYSAMDPEGDQMGDLERTSGSGVMPKKSFDTKPGKSAMQPAPMDDGMIDELINKPGTAAAPKASKVQPADDSMISEVVGGGLPRQRFRVKGAANQDEADEAAAAVDYVDRGKGKIDYYRTGKKRRKFRIEDQ